MVANIASITFSDDAFSIASSSGDLRRRSRSSTTSASLISLLGIALFSAVPASIGINVVSRSEEHTSELQSHVNLVCRLLLEKKKKEQGRDDADEYEGRRA